MNLLLIAPNKLKQWNRINSDWFKYLDQFCTWHIYDVNYDLDNPDELIEAIKQLTRNDVLYNKFKENCRTASQELNWENEVKNLLEKL